MDRNTPGGTVLLRPSGLWVAPRRFHPGRLPGWPCFVPRGAYRRFAALPVVQGRLGALRGLQARTGAQGVRFPGGSPLWVASRPSLPGCLAGSRLGYPCFALRHRPQAGQAHLHHAALWPGVRGCRRGIPRKSVSAAGVARGQAPGGATGLPTGANVRRATPTPAVPVFRQAQLRNSGPLLRFPMTWRRASCCPLRPGFTPGLAFCPPAGAGGLLRSPPVPGLRDRSSRWRW